MESYLVKLAAIFNVVYKTIEEMKPLILLFQEIYGLKTDGEIGPVTKRALDAQRVCANLEPLGVKTYGFVDQPISVHFKGGTLRHGTMDDVDACLYHAIQEIHRVCGAQLEIGTNSGATIAFQFGSIDGAFGTLAKSELATPDYQTPRQWYDDAEPWHFDPDTPPRQGRISLALTMLHELVHALGVPHGGAGVMAPIYNPAVTSLQPGYDIDSLQKLYGPPAVEAPTPPLTVDAHVLISQGDDLATYSGMLKREG